MAVGGHAFARAAERSRGLEATSSDCPKPRTFGFARREQLALHLQLLEEALVDMAAAVGHDRGQHPRLRMPRIIPAGISCEGVPADSADIDTTAHRVAHLVADIMEP